MNPLQDLMIQLAAQSGPRGALFAGRRIRPGGVPDLKTLMTQRPNDIPEESYGMLPGMNPAALMGMQGGMSGGRAGLQEAMRNYFANYATAIRYYEDKKAEQNAR